MLVHARSQRNGIPMRHEHPVVKAAFDDRQNVRKALEQGTGVCALDPTFPPEQLGSVRVRDHRRAGSRKRDDPLPEALEDCLTLGGCGQ